MAGLRAIVTGAGSGLGAASAIRLSAPGVKLVINFVSNSDGANLTADRCRQAGADVIVAQGDVSQDDDCRRIAATAAEWRGLDALINNAGITKHVDHALLEQLSSDDFQRIYAVNTVGAFQMARATRTLLEEGARQSKRSSAIVNISSIAGVTGTGSSLAYVASKGGLNAMTLSLARALAPAIRVNAVCPGYIDTPWFEKGRGAEAASRVRQTVRDSVPLKVASTAHDVAELVCFLAGPHSSHITGELMRIDAGMHLRG
jgi:3-oxoacyl-[acyl-carrier protein] reductase